MSPEKIIFKLHHLRRSMENINPHAAELRPLMDELWNTVTAANEESLITEVMQHQDYNSLSAFFAPRWRTHISVLEKQQSITAVSDSSVLLLEKYDDQGLKQELDPIIRLSIHQNFVMVGSGPFPETLMRARVKKGPQLRAIGIDKCEESLTLSKNVVNGRGFDNEITFVCAEGSEFDYASAGVILLANGLHNKRCVLSRVANTMPKDAVILVRNPVRLGHLFYEDFLSSGLISGLKVVNWVEPSSLSRTYFLHLES